MVYFDKALMNTNRSLVGTMRKAMDGVSYDTIVGTGLSGTILTARVAPTLKKKFAIVRKPDDTSTHSSNRIEGQVGTRWVFADDFVSGGDTLKRVIKKMKQYYPGAEFVGVYQSEGGVFTDPDESAYRWGAWVTDLTIGALYGPRTREQVLRERPWDTVPLRAPEKGWHRSMRKFLTIAPRDRLVVNELDGYYGRPTIFDRDSQIVWGCEDAQALPYIEEIENAAASLGVGLRRMYGERLDRLPKPRPARVYRNPPEELDYVRGESVIVNVPGLQAFNEAARVADRATYDLMKELDPKE